MPIRNLDRTRQRYANVCRCIESGPELVEPPRKTNSQISCRALAMQTPLAARRSLSLAPENSAQSLSLPQRDHHPVEINCDKTPSNNRAAKEREWSFHGNSPCARK